MLRRLTKRLVVAGEIGLAGLVLATCSSAPHVTEVPTVSVPETNPAPTLPPEEPKVILHGKASYYANAFDGKTTASGEPLDQNALTAASKTLPLGAHATVTNLTTGQSVDVAINDRGPYVPGRIIDLSKRAADTINLDDKGVAPVKIEAKPEDQPTPELRRKVAKIAADRERAKKRAAAHKAQKPKPQAPDGTEAQQTTPSEIAQKN